MKNEACLTYIGIVLICLYCQAESSAFVPQCVFEWMRAKSPTFNDWCGTHKPFSPVLACVFACVFMCVLVCWCVRV